MPVFHDAVAQRTAVQNLYRLQRANGWYDLSKINRTDYIVGFGDPMSGALVVTSDEFFPDSPRIFYDNAPLQQVVCQFRFPQILRIEAEIPSEFQEHIRSVLPIVERSEPLGVPLQLPKQILDILSAQQSLRSYQFFNEARTSWIELASGSVTCITKQYSRWEQFIVFVETALDAFVKIYKPAFYTRIGLRYVDLIDKGAIGLENSLWQDLLSKPILGELGEHFIESNVEAIQKSLRVRNSDGTGGFLLQHGLVDGSKKSAYYIDFDFYIDHKTELRDARATLNRLHDRSGLAWRWSITPTLHEALGPHNI